MTTNRHIANTQPYWLKVERDKRAVNADFTCTPITSLTVRFLAPDGFERYVVYHIDALKEVGIEDLVKAIGYSEKQFTVDLLIDEELENRIKESRE